MHHNHQNERPGSNPFRATLKMVVHLEEGDLGAGGDALEFVDVLRVASLQTLQHLFEGPANLLA